MESFMPIAIDFSIRLGIRLKLGQFETVFTYQAFSHYFTDDGMLAT